MKKYLKYLSIIILISIIFTCLIFKNRILLCFSIGNKLIKNDLILDDDIEYENNIIKDIVYKSTNNKNLTLDLYKAKIKENKKSPVLIYIHGGSWSYGDKTIPEMLYPILNLFNEEGYSIISISYELMSNEINFEKQISDVKDAIRWVNKNKDIYNFNVNEVGLIGISSGAHLALMAGYTDNNEFTDDMTLISYPSNVKYILDFFGPTDLSTIDISKANEHIKNSLENNSNKDYIINKYSPINYIKKSKIKTLIVHSDSDNVVPYSNAISFYNKNKSIGNNTELLTLKNYNHNIENISINDIKELSISILKFIILNSPLN